MRLDPIHSAFVDVEKMLNLLCSRFRRKYGGVHAEYMSEASFAFMEAFHEDDGRGEFTTWVWHKVYWRLREYVRAEFRRRAPIKALAEDYACCAESVFDLAEVMRDLSDDAKMVVDAVLNMPVRVRRILKKQPHLMSGDPYYQKLAMKDYLRLFNWTSKRIRETFDEVREALG